MDFWQCYECCAEILTVAALCGHMTCVLASLLPPDLLWKAFGWSLQASVNLLCIMGRSLRTLVLRGAGWVQPRARGLPSLHLVPRPHRANLPGGGGCLLGL